MPLQSLMYANCAWPGSSHPDCGPHMSRPSCVTLLGTAVIKQAMKVTLTGT
jgi:hypothetical protein